MAKKWGGEARVEYVSSPEDPPEAQMLLLDSILARNELPWTPRWSLDECITETVVWHHALRNGVSMKTFSEDQIRRYETAPGQ